MSLLSNKMIFRLMDLPAEIRELIWLQCLPKRVFEVDSHVVLSFWGYTDKGEWTYGPGDCVALHTSILNMRSPAIAAVCRETRDIASRNMRRVKDIAYLNETGFASKDQLTYMPFAGLVDYSRSIPHLYYESDCTDCYMWSYSIGASLSPLGYLSLIARNIGSPIASFRSCYLDRHGRAYGPDNPPENLENEPPYTDELSPEAARALARDPWSYERDSVLQTYDDTKAIASLPMWQVVMHEYSVHMSSEEALRSGLWGLLGDEPVQNVELTDTARLAAFGEAVMAGEALARPERARNTEHLSLSAETANRELAWKLRSYRYPYWVHERLRPALMFRLCTLACASAEKIPQPILHEVVYNMEEE